jgi:fructokinase
MTQTSQHPRPLIFGEVLFDCFPDGSRVLGGAPFNVAWHLRALALNPLFVSRVGVDSAGDEILAAMRDWGMDLSGVQRDPDHPTGRVEISFSQGQPSYTIVPDQAYDHPAVPDELGGITLIYHGSLALRGLASRAALATIRARCRTSVFVDVNLRNPWWDPKTVGGLLDGARWCKLNDIELASLAGPGEPADAAGRLIDRHGLDQVVVTLGAAGALALRADGACNRVAPVRDVAVVDTVGAGDAFASVLIAGILQGWPIPVTLRRAQGLASAVCGLRGALPRETAFYRDLLMHWEND